MVETTWWKPHGGTIIYNTYIYKNQDKRKKGALKMEYFIAAILCIILKELRNIKKTMKEKEKEKDVENKNKNEI